MITLPSIRGFPKKVNINKKLIKWDDPSASSAQFKTKKFLKDYWAPDRVCEEFIIPGSRLRIDFINFSKKIVIEVSGQQHEKFVKFYHKNRLNFLSSVKRDMQKIDWVESKMKFKFIEIYDNEVDMLSENFFLERFDINL